jgi:hypothetical protein
MFVESLERTRPAYRASASDTDGFRRVRLISYRTMGLRSPRRWQTACLPAEINQVFSPDCGVTQPQSSSHTSSRGAAVNSASGQPLRGV